MEISSLTSGISTLLTPSSDRTGSGKALSLTLGSGTSTQSGLRLSTTKNATDTSETFAAELMRRIESATAGATSNAAGTIASGAAGNLQAALAETIDYVRQNHGDAAATAVMGIILSGVGDGSGGEDALGNALVSSLSFIDRNFGITAGNAAIAHYNGALNNAVNGYFQNGHSEEFYASDGTTDLSGQVQNVLSSAVSDVTERFGTEAAKAVSDILTDSLEETGVNREGLGTAVAAADRYLDENYGVSDLLGSRAGSPTNLARGTVLNLAV